MIALLLGQNKYTAVRKRQVRYLCCLPMYGIASVVRVLLKITIGLNPFQFQSLQHDDVLARTTHPGSKDFLVLEIKVIETSLFYITKVVVV